MIETRGDPGLVDEHRHELLVVREVLAQPLDDHELVEAQASGAHRHRHEDVCHASVTQLGDESIFSELGVGHRRDAWDLARALYGGYSVPS